MFSLWIVVVVLIATISNTTCNDSRSGFQTLVTQFNGIPGDHGLALHGRPVPKNLFVQRVSATGSSYALLGRSYSEAYFHRPVKDFGRKYVLFKDSTYPKGSGHYIVLVRVKNPSSLRKGQDVSAVYEAFNLHFTKTLKAFVQEWSDVEPNHG